MIEILDSTTKNPITTMGARAGICWGTDTSDDVKNYKRGLTILQDGHGRVQEFVNVEMVISDYSARVIREWYTHIGGAPTRLQESTRYIDYSNKGFEYTIPNSIKRDIGATSKWIKMMQNIRETLADLENNHNIPKEDVGLGLPLAMKTKIVDKRNLRNLIEMSHQRMCNRANWEYRQLFNELCTELSNYSEEWKYLVDNYMKPKCEIMGYCPESKGCGKLPKKEN